MEENFAPSYFNIAMGFWENSHTLKSNHFSAHVFFFARYIDVIIVIWDSAPDLIRQFVQYCNNNTYGLSFTFVTDPTSLVFLDLELGHNGDTICARNDVKPTAGNSYLHYNSCHYPKWI